MQTIITALQHPHIIIPTLITIILCLTSYLIGILKKSAQERETIQEIADLSDQRDERLSAYFHEYNTKANHYTEKHKLYTSFIVFLDRTQFNMNINPEKTENDITTFNQKIEEIKQIANQEIKTKITEYITLNHNYTINTTHLKTAMQKELTLT